MTLPYKVQTYIFFLSHIAYEYLALYKPLLTLTPYCDSSSCALNRYSINVSPCCSMSHSCPPLFAAYRRVSPLVSYRTSSFISSFVSFILAQAIHACHTHTHTHTHTRTFHHIMPPCISSHSDLFLPPPYTHTPFLFPPPRRLLLTIALTICILFPPPVPFLQSGASRRCRWSLTRS